MSKGSNTTRSGGSSTRSATANGRSEYTALVRSYSSNVDADFQSINDYTGNGAVGRLQGSVINDAVNSVTNIILSMDNVDSVTQLRQYDDRLSAARRNALASLDEKIDVLQHNSQLAKGRSQSTYRQAIDNLQMARYELSDKLKNGSYNLDKEAKIEEWLIKRNKW